jgi:hypothetical protein
MRAPGLPVEVTVAEEPDLVPPEGYARLRLRRERHGDRWKAVLTVHPLEGLDPDDLLAHAHDFSIEDRDGPVGIVEDVRLDGTIVVASGWFGRRRLTLGFDDVEEIVPSERLLILRPGAVARPDR